LFKSNLVSSRHGSQNGIIGAAGPEHLLIGAERGTPQKAWAQPKTIGTLPAGADTLRRLYGAKVEKQGL